MRSKTCSPFRCTCLWEFEFIGLYFLWCFHSDFPLSLIFDFYVLTFFSRFAKLWRSCFWISMIWITLLLTLRCLLSIFTKQFVLNTISNFTSPQKFCITPYLIIRPKTKNKEHQYLEVSVSCAVMSELSTVIVRWHIGEYCIGNPIIFGINRGRCHTKSATWFRCYKNMMPVEF